MLKCVAGEVAGADVAGVDAGDTADVEEE